MLVQAVIGKASCSRVFSGVLGFKDVRVLARKLHALKKPEFYNNSIIFSTGNNSTFYKSSIRRHQLYRTLKVVLAAIQGRNASLF